jgi:ribosome-associated translation inhibitor RaiA
MTIRLNLLDRGKLLSPGLAQHIDLRAQKLGRFFPKVEECQVRVDGPGEHPRPGRVRVRIHLRITGGDIEINHRTGEDLALAIRESFDAADQRLEDFARRSTRSSKRAKRSPARGPSRHS